MVDRDRDAGAAEVGDQLRGLLDRLRAVVVGAKRSATAAAAGAEDRRACFAQRRGDAATGAAGRASDHGHATSQRVSAQPSSLHDSLEHRP